MVKSNQKVIQIYSDLGLSLIQAKIYSALIQTGISSVKIISKASTVPRPDVYRILPQLEDLGLVNKIISNPIKYEPLNIQESLEILFERRADKTNKLIKIKKELINEFSRKKIKKQVLSENEQFIMIPKKRVMIRKRAREIANTQYSIDTVSSWRDLPKRIIYFKEEIEKALNRGIKIRYILERPENSINFKELVAKLPKSPNIKFRLIDHPPEAIFTIFDNNRCLIKTSTTKEFEDSQSLWSNNETVLSIVEDLFERMWNIALEFAYY